MKKILSILLLSLMTAPSLFAQRKQEDLDLKIREMMKVREEMIRSLFNDSAFGSFDDSMDDHFEDLIKKFQQNGFGAMPGMDMGDVVEEYDWRETDKDVTFALKVNQIKDKPLDIKIEKGQIKLKGDVESINEDKSKKLKRVSRAHFEKIFSIPEGVDQNNPEFENKNGELRIRFKKKMKKVKKEDDRLPIEKDVKDVSI